MGAVNVNRITNRMENYATAYVVVNAICKIIYLHWYLDFDIQENDIKI